MSKCPMCGSSMIYDTKNDIISYKGHEQAIPTFGLWCTNTKCNEAIFTGEALLNNENKFQIFKKDIDSHYEN